jgi:hypothetical protein
MTRELDTVTLTQAAKDYAGQFLLPTVPNPHNSTFAPIGGRGWVLHSMEHFHFEDEFDYFFDKIKGYLGPLARAEFDDEVSRTLTPYDPGELEAELALRLAITPSGDKIPNAKGLVKRKCIPVGWYYETKTDANGRRMPQILQVHVRVGESDDEAVAKKIKHAQDTGLVVFPMYTMPPTMALNTRISNGPAITMCDAMVDSLDLGTGAAIVRGYSGAQPTDPDTAASGTLLFTLTCSDPAFGAASDIAPGARATASAITNDSSADATATVGYCRGWTTNDGATPLAAKIDGEAGTSGADFNFNTVSIVSGATVGMTSWTITMPES